LGLGALLQLQDTVSESSQEAKGALDMANHEEDSATRTGTRWGRNFEMGTLDSADGSKELALVGVGNSAVRPARDAEPCSHVHQLGQGRGLHLAHHLAPVRLHGDLADAELGTDLLVQKAGDYQRQDFSFTPTEQRMPIPEGDISASWPSAARLRWMAARMAERSASLFSGFVRNSTAPAFMAFTLVGTSPQPVMKMIGMLS
jgi:hypothetical protein